MKQNIRTADYTLDLDIDLKRGLAIQREQFKEARVNNDYLTMRMCLENIKNDVYYKAKKNDLNSKLNNLKKIFLWFDSLERIYSKNTREGRQVVYPANIHVKVNQIFGIAYEILMGIQEELRLL